jgi:tRNA threonylcarbamoyladenosine modification (KEOPS) complex  Pcc1 subunit
MYHLKLTVSFDSNDDALFFFKSINPELDEDYLRSKTKVLKSKNKLFFLIDAIDKTALRASLNSIRKPLNLFFSINGGN